MKQDDNNLSMDQNQNVISSDSVGQVVSGNDQILTEEMVKAQQVAEQQKVAVAPEIVKQEAVEQAKQEVSQQVELQNQLQQQELLKQQQFQQQQQVMQQEQQAEKERQAAALKEEIAKQNMENEGGTSNFKRFLCFLLIAFFLAFVYFLPEITEFVNNKKSELNQQEITTGYLTCTMTKDTENLNVDMEALFYFTNSEIMKLTYTTTYTGDANADKEELNRLNQECIVLKNAVVPYNGISAQCNLSNGVSVQKQIFDYEKLNEEEITSAYTEAGGIYPEYKKGDKISGIESKMVSSGYNCKKHQ